jgi:hypothetical protein
VDREEDAGAGLVDGHDDRGAVALRQVAHALHQQARVVRVKPATSQATSILSARPTPVRSTLTRSRGQLSSGHHDHTPHIKWCVQAWRGPTRR